MPRLEDSGSVSHGWPLRLRTMTGTIVLLLCAASIGALPQAERVTTLRVIGEGIVEVPPDSAIARIGVESVAVTVDESLAESRRIIADMSLAIEELGVASEDIHTANYSFAFERPSGAISNRPSQEVRAYRTNNTLTVIVRDLSITPRIIDAAVNAGANWMEELEFSVADPGAVKLLALRQASLDARSRADYIAELSGQLVADLVSISEGDYSSRTIARAEESGLSGTGIGLLRFSVRLEVTYSLKPSMTTE